ncbi:recombinase family protein [Polyangium spumosum]|nr:recombinase family protein [Polyangium spumosum]
MRAALYVRRSTEEHQADSIEVQTGEGRRYIERKGWSLDPAHVFVDDAVSRAEFKKRPGLFSMLNAAEKKAFDVVVVRDESRLGGDTNRTSLLIQDLLDSGARLFYYFSDEEVRVDGAIDKFMVSVRSFASELEREKISQRTRENHSVKARKGLVTGGKTYGYSNVEVKDGERRLRVEYAINEDEAKIVREIFTRYADGEGLKSIAKDLNARGVPSPRGRGWAQSALLPMTERETYIGILTWGRAEKAYRGGTKVRVPRPEHEWTRVEMPHMRIVDDELWNRVQARKVKKTSFGRTRNSGAPPKYLLSGLSRCGVCGGRLQVIPGKAGVEPTRVYICSNYREKKTCSNSLRRPVEAVDAAVLSYVERKILTEEVISMVLREVRARLKVRSEGNGDEVAELEAQARKVKTELDRLGAALVATDDKPETVLRMITEREQRLSALNGRIAILKTAPQVLDLEVRRLEKDAKKRLEDLRGLTEKRPEDARRALERLLVGPLTMSPVETPEGRRYRVTGKTGLSSMDGVPSGIRNIANPRIGGFALRNRGLNSRHAGWLKPSAFVPMA